MIWFTSDWHIGHKNIIKYCNRPFQDTDEMEKTLIDNYNKRVSPNDTVYFLGDLGFINGNKIKILMEKLHGNKHIILGNHDRFGLNVYTTFKTVERLETIRGKYNDYILCHFPLVSWDRQKYGTIHIHGHQHNSKEYNEKMRNDHILRFDCGVDANNFNPVSEEQILQFFGEEVLKNPSFDHHN